MQKPAFTMSPLAFAAFLLATTAHAQSSTAITAAEPETLPTVTITASADASKDGLSKAYAGGQVARGGRLGILGNVDMMSAPFNATNYTAQFVADQQAASIGDVLAADPGVRVTRGFGNFQESYVIHGFELYSDDVGYNGLYGILPRQYVSPELLERVEVFKGASSFLNGAAPGGSGLGGAINLVPKRAGNTPLTEFTAGIASGGQGYGAVDIGRRFGDNNQFGVRVNAVKRKGETSVDDQRSEVSLLTVGLDYRAGNLRVSADLGYQDFDLTAPRPSVTVSGTAVPAAPDASKNSAQPWTYSKERDTFGTVRAEYDVNQNVTAWAAFGGRAGVESNSLANMTSLSSDGSASFYRFDNAGKRNTRTGETGVRGKLATGAVTHTLVASASGFWLDSRNAYGFGGFGLGNTNLYAPTTTFIPTSALSYGNDINDPRTTQKAILSSYAIADTMGFQGDTVLLTLGARRQTIKDQGYAYNTGLATATHYDASATTPVAAVVYKVRSDLSLYANYSEGLVQGGIVGSDYSNRGTVLSPYKTKQKEVGVKYDGGKLGMTAALYTAAKPIGTGVLNGLYSLGGEQRNRGLDVSVFGVPAQGLRLLGGLSLLEAEQRGTAFSGKDALGAPKTQLNLGTEWDVPGAAGLALTARAIYTSRQYINPANTMEIGAWTRFDLGARYVTRIADRDVTLRARIDNVADRNYWASAVVSSDSGALVLGAPRSVTLSATVGF
ncbi:iron complex outermembrane receptor protein [Duganella sp. 3397]|uniref:TonB-dependent receptor n=1 Tax=Duganella sp. 3397 TaxID=2817732 RepID=UPI002862AEC3|nr:TonB-dependent siderophore receptor [Duganella sp. 3397]MDR7048682.1 iron complex outermembrane receptor protein [Duganella sp. 3397]